MITCCAPRRARRRRFRSISPTFTTATGVRCRSIWNVWRFRCREFYRKDRRLRFSNRAELEAKFGLGPRTRVVLIGSGRDVSVEAWWKLSEHRSDILAGLRALGVALVTGPNYSMFTDEVRYNDMHAMKRIALTWQEIVASGTPAAYHLNARTAQDYRRLTAFIASRPEVTDVTFEFKTGAAWRRRLRIHLGEMCRLAARVGRPLHLVMIGGMNALPILASAFARVTFIDSSAFMNAVHRQRLILDNEGMVRKLSELTLTGQAIDPLFVENIATMRACVERRLP